MGTLNTSLHIGYQPKLDVIWALREIGSNAIDGERRNEHLDIGKMTVEYSKRSNRLTVRNDGVTVPTTALLMGTSESRGDDHCIGQFGEGLPMALLVLARNHIAVSITNGNERWEPIIERSNGYQGEPVLAIKTRKLPKDYGHYEVVVEGIDEILYQQFQAMYLRFDPDFDPSMVAKSPGGQEQVLLQAKYQGSIYNKGVFVQKRDDIMFGYDLHGELNRDRSFMDEWSLKRNLGTLLSRCVTYSDTTFTDMVTKALIDNNGVLEVSDEYSDLVYNGPLGPKVQEVFINKYGDSAVPVETEEEVKEADAIGLRGIKCSHVLRRIVTRRTGSLADIKAKRSNSVVRTWAASSMGEVERNHLSLVARLVQGVIPDARTVQFVAVESASQDVKFVHDASTRTVQLSYHHLLDMEVTLTSAAKGALMIVSSAFPEVTPVLARMVTQLATGSGPASLALMAHIK